MSSLQNIPVPSSPTSWGLYRMFLGFIFTVLYNDLFQPPCRESDPTIHCLVLADFETLAEASMTTQLLHGACLLIQYHEGATFCYQIKMYPVPSTMAVLASVHLRGPSWETLFQAVLQMLVLMKQRIPSLAFLICLQNSCTLLQKPEKHVVRLITAVTSLLYTNLLYQLLFPCFGGKIPGRSNWRWATV